MSSKTFKQVRFSLYECDPMYKAGCFNSSEIAAHEATMGQFYVDVGIIQNSINAGSPKYKDYYF